MFETTIQFKGKERKFRLGAWVTGEIEKLLKKDVGNIEMFAYIIYFGLIQGEGLRIRYMTEEDLGFDVMDCYDWIDEQGGIASDEVQRVQKLYVAHAETNVPKNSKATAPKEAKAGKMEAKATSQAK